MADRRRVPPGVELLEWTGRDVAVGTVAVSFVFAGGRVTVHNALDENGIELAEPDPRWRRHHVGGAKIS